jgi:hypothetical protein
MPSPSMSASPFGPLAAPAMNSPPTVGVSVWPLQWHAAHWISKDLGFGGSTSSLVVSLKSQSPW